MKKLVLALLLFSSPALAHTEHVKCDYCAIDQPVDIGTLETKMQSHFGKTVDILDEYLVAQYKESKIVDNLRTIPGVETKSIAGLSSVRIRGLRPYDTVWLYNGVPMRDPSEPQGSFAPYVDNLLVSGRTQLEVMNGAGSTVYGSQAIGGVVGIVPLTNDWGLSSEFGPKYTEIVTTPYGAITRQDDGKADNTQFHAEHEWEHIKAWILHNNATTPVNNSPSVKGGKVKLDRNDPNDRSEEELWVGGVRLMYEPWIWTLSGLDSQRRFLFLPNDDGSGFYSDGTYNGKNYSSDFKFKQWDTIFGWTYTHDYYILETNAKQDEIDRFENDFYAERTFSFDNLDLTLGVRNNLNESVKDRLVYDVSTVYHIDDSTRIRSHIGTGFRSPSVYELAGAYLTSSGRSEIGNPGLSSERSLSYDFGLEKQFGEIVTIGLNYFDTSVKNRIGFINSKYHNLPGKYNPHGIEAYYEQFLFGFTSLRMAYTQTLAENLLDIGRHKVEISLRAEKKKWNASIRLRATEKHQIELFNDDTFKVDRLNEDGGVTLDATAAYKITENLEAYVRADNIFSEQMTIGGYRQSGCLVYGGIKYDW